MADSMDEFIDVTFQFRTVKYVIAFFVLLFTFLFVKSECVAYVDSYEIGYSYNSRTGHLHRINRTGYIFHEPWFVEVNTVDLRPLQVCINANQRVLNCKLVKFNPAGLALFLSWHGRQDYDLGSLEPILMSYAYENAGHTYPFLTVVREMNTTDSATRTTP